MPADVASRRVFFAYAGRAMQSVIIDHVRQRGAKKRGEGVAEVTLPTGFEGEAEVYTDDRIERLEAAMSRLERIDATLHQIVQLRYFAGMTVEQVAELLELPVINVKRRWTQARTILAKEMGEDLAG
jgi:RNA polymerase sigma factor (TIGR02999 family)